MSPFGVSRGLIARDIFSVSDRVCASELQKCELLKLVQVFKRGREGGREGERERESGGETEGGRDGGGERERERCHVLPVLTPFTSPGSSGMEVLSAAAAAASCARTN